MGIFGVKSKWLVTIILHCDLLVTVKDTNIYHYGFSLREPLLYN
jgi:hypothetical protein